MRRGVRGDQDIFISRRGNRGQSSVGSKKSFSGAGEGFSWGTSPGTWGGRGLSGKYEVSTRPKARRNEPTYSIKNGERENDHCDAGKIKLDSLARFAASQKSLRDRKENSGESRGKRKDLRLRT